MTDESTLITGATGAIGSEVLKQLYSRQKPSSISIFVRPSKKATKLVKNYPGINVFYGSINNEEELARACVKQTYIIHLAAVIPPLANEQPELTKSVNIEGTRTLVKVMEEHSPNAFLIYSSSVATYGDRMKNPDILVSDPLTPSLGDDYGATKVLTERIIQESKLNWTIYRLSAIMGIGNHKVSKIMFHVPLETQMEITTVRDTARAFVHSIGKRDKLNGSIFNLGGGKECRITYLDFMTRAFDAYGMGKVDFPEHAFATANFHCGNYIDGDLLDDILEFRTDTMDSYFERFAAAVPSAQRLCTRLVSKPVKLYLSQLSEPLKAYKKQDPALLQRFFGDDHPHR